MTTEDDFQLALDAHPDDWQTRLVFADWLDEHSDERAAGYRWLGRAGKWPSTEAVAAGGNLRWQGTWRRWTDVRLPVPNDQLPSALFKRVALANEMPNWNPLHHAYFRTRRGAEDALARAFVAEPVALIHGEWPQPK